MHDAGMSCLAPLQCTESNEEDCPCNQPDLADQEEQSGYSINSHRQHTWKLVSSASYAAPVVMKCDQAREYKKREERNEECTCKHPHLAHQDRCLAECWAQPISMHDKGTQSNFQHCRTVLTSWQCPDTWTQRSNIARTPLNITTQEDTQSAKSQYGSKAQSPSKPNSTLALVSGEATSWGMQKVLAPLIHTLSTVPFPACNSYFRSSSSKQKSVALVSWENLA